MDIRRVSDGACIGPIIIQSGVDQRDRGVPTWWASLPLDAIQELTFRWKERLGGEVEKLEGEEEE